MKGATEEVAKATKLLADLIAKLGETGSAAEVKAKYEAEIKSLQEAFTASVAEHKKMNDQIMEIWKKTVERLAAVENALITG